MKPLVCIGFAEAISAPEVAWSLVDAGFQVVAFARRGRRSALRHSRHVRCTQVTPPESDFEAARAELEGLLTSLQTAAEEQVIFPLDDAAVWLCNKLRHDAGWVCDGPRGYNAELTLDKWMQMQKARWVGLKVPDTSLARSPEDVFARGGALPLILKPTDAVWPRDGRLQNGRRWICADQWELERAVAEWNATYPLLVQPFIRGTGEGLFGLATNEGALAWSAHRRIRMMNPHGSGSSACVSQRVSPALKPSVEEFIRQTGWRGLFMVEFLRDREGTAWFMEFNGRPWGSMALSRRRGFEYPAWSVHLALHPGSGVVAPQEAEKPLVCRNAGRECMHLLFVLRGPQSRAINGWPGFWRTLVDVVRVERADSFYNWRPDDKRVFLSDWWYTIREHVFKSRN